MYTVVTHSGSFHADDVFAIAAFWLLLGKENVEVIRTRDVEIISQGDYVVDVGEVYDHELRRYDHHQNGSPVRENGVPYAGFGLMWKHYGEKICDSLEVATVVDRKLCQPIDACDNAIQVWDEGKFGLAPLEWDTIVKGWRSLSYDNAEMTERFLQIAEVARQHLEYFIAKEHKKISDREAAEAFYHSSEDKEILISDIPISRAWFIPFAEPKVLVCPRDESADADWMAIAVQVSENGFETRVQFPQTWAGLRTEELINESGFDDAVFCHKDRYMFIAESKESAIKAAQQAE